MRKYINILLLGFFLFLAGCTSTQEDPGLFSWETIGIVSTGSLNNHVDEAAENHKNDLENQTKIAQITASIASELKYTASKDDDKPAWERAIVIETKAAAAAAEAAQLSEVTWTKAPPPSMGFGDIISMILQLLGVGSTGGLGLVAMKFMSVKKELNAHKDKVQQQDKTLTRVKKKAKKFANSTVVDNIEDDEDLT